VTLLVLDNPVPGHETFTIWQCDYCLKTSAPVVYQGYWEGARMANKDLNKHREDKHDGLLFKGNKVTVKSIRKAKKRAKELRHAA